MIYIYLFIYTSYMKHFFEHNNSENAINSSQKKKKRKAFSFQLFLSYCFSDLFWKGEGGSLVTHEVKIFCSIFNLSIIPISYHLGAMLSKSLLGARAGGREENANLRFKAKPISNLLNDFLIVVCILAFRQLFLLFNK